MKKIRILAMLMLAVALMLFAFTSCGNTEDPETPEEEHVHAFGAATCTEPATCECGETEGEALGHTVVNDAAVAATCTTPGKTAGQHCSACGLVVTAQQLVDALGHTYNTTVTEPTCATDGYTTYTCSCGDSYIADEVDSDGHNYVDGKCACGANDPDYAPPVGSADFDTINTGLSSGGDASYTKTFETTNGWTTVNSAVQVGGSTVMNPAYPVVGETKDDKAICLNGKTTAPGKVTSPTLTGGISKLTLVYTKMFTDTALSVTITVTDVATGTKYTKTVEREVHKDNDKYVVWTEEWVLDTAIAGEFTIEIVNNCPSGNTGNKDRFTILELTWVGKN